MMLLLLLLLLLLNKFKLINLLGTAATFVGHH